MKLYDLDLSGNCYKCRLLLSILGVDYDRVPIDFLGGEHTRPPLSDLNPFHEIPVLQDGDVTLRDSQAILVYLARRFGGEGWLPTAADGLARVTQWLSTAANEIARGPNDARLHDKFGIDLDVDLARTKAGRILGLVEDRLTTRDWLEFDRPTIADIAVFPYIAVGHEGGVGLDDFSAIRAWIERIKALPGFVPMPGLA